jgi:hypothetical protein
MHAVDTYDLLWKRMKKILKLLNPASTWPICNPACMAIRIPNNVLRVSPCIKQMPQPGNIFSLSHFRLTTLFHRYTTYDCMTVPNKYYTSCELMSNVVF